MNTQEAASSALNYAIRTGRVRRPDGCERCGVVGPVQGHHRDYQKPLLVEWLCRCCHRREHVAHPGSARATARPLFIVRVPIQPKTKTLIVGVAKKHNATVAEVTSACLEAVVLELGIETMFLKQRAREANAAFRAAGAQP